MKKGPGISGWSVYLLHNSLCEIFSQSPAYPIFQGRDLLLGSTPSQEMQWWHNHPPAPAGELTSALQPSHALLLSCGGGRHQKKKRGCKCSIPRTAPSKAEWLGERRKGGVGQRMQGRPALTCAGSKVGLAAIEIVLVPRNCSIVWQRAHLSSWQERMGNQDLQCCGTAFTSGEATEPRILQLRTGCVQGWVCYTSTEQHRKVGREWLLVVPRELGFPLELGDTRGSPGLNW